MNRTMLTVAGLLSASSLLLVDSAVKGTVLLALAAVAALILRRDSAATRHLVWLLAIVALLVVPLLSAMLPQWRVLPAWASHSPQPAVVDVAPPSIVRPSNVAVELPQALGPPEIERPSLMTDQSAAEPSDSRVAVATPKIKSESKVWSWNWITALPLVWAIGFCVLILRLTAARWLLWNSERRAAVVWRRARGVGIQPADDREKTSGRLEAYPTTLDPIVTAMETICSQLGIGRPVTLLIHPDKTIPVVWGILRCRLMLPAAARQWSDEQLRSVLLHELAHTKRRDPLVQLLAQVACALHWFNPLVWFAASRLDVERERACDDLVLASGVRPSAYAGHLLGVVTGLSPTRWTQSCGLAMARQSSLEGRLTAVLGKDLNRRSVSVALAGLALAVAVGIAVPIAMLRAADEKWNPPQVAHIVSNDFSSYCVHDGKDSSFVIAYHGDFGSATESSSNAKTRTWSDSGTITAKKPGIALTFHRTHTAPAKLSITTAPTEARDLSKPAPPPRQFGQKEYDLLKGRVLLLSDSGGVRQLDIATPVVTDQASAKKLAALIAAVPPQEREDVAPTPNRTGKLATETVAKLKWGEPVNGLRMALAYPPALGDALLGKKPHFELVVQNVTEKEVDFLASDAIPNPRRMLIREGDRVVLGISDPTVSAADWKLQPGQSGVLRLYTKEELDKAGTIPSSAIESDLRKLGLYHAIAEMEIAKAPAGAWTGKLVTGPTRGSADVAAAPAAMHKDLPAEFRDEVNRQLDIAGVSDVQQAEIFEKPAAAPAATPDPKTGVTVPAKKASAEGRRPGDGEVVFLPRNFTRPFPVLDAGDGVTLAIKEQVFHGADVVTSVRIRYMAADGSVTGHDVGVAVDAFANREQWAVLWVRGTKTLWHVNGEFDGRRLRLYRTDFADPRHIVTAYDANYEGEPLDALGIPAEVRAKFEKHFGVVNPKLVDKSGGLPDVAGESVAAARALKPDGSLPEIRVTPQPLTQRWKVQFVDAATGQPVSRVRMTLTRSKTDGSLKSFVTRVVWDDRTLNPELAADEYGFFTITDEALMAAEGGGRSFGNVSDGMKVAERHTNPAVPFLVKLKPRGKQANADADAAKPPPFTVWGKELNGLKAGLGFKAGGKRAYSHGEKVTLVVRVRNVGKEEAKFDYIPEQFIENPPTVLDEKAKAVPIARGLVDTGVQIGREANLAPGKEIELAEVTLEFNSRNEADAGFRKSLTIYGTGKFQVGFDNVLGTGFIKPDPALSKLATGKLELEIKPVMPVALQGSNPDTQAKDELQMPIEKYGPQDWAGWFVNQVQFRKQSDGSYPAVAFKSLRKWVIADLADEPNAPGAVEARDWLETTAADKKWVSEDFRSLVERIGTWKLSVIQRALPDEEVASRSFPKPGRPATADELRGLSFGPATENGLRIAWVFDPAKRDYAIGESLKCRVMLHNSGSQPVQFVAWDVLDGVWTIRDETGKPIQMEDVDYGRFWNLPRMANYQRCRLAPGHIVEIQGKGIGIGDGDHSASKNQMAIWRIIHARVGDAVQFNVEAKLGLVRRFGELSSDVLIDDEFPEEKSRDWSGSLRSGEVKFNVVAAAVSNKDEPKPGAMLKPATEQMLKWGEPTNGLRAALVMHPVPDEPDAADKNDIFLVVQNVSEEAIWLHSSDAAPNPRQLIWRENGKLETIHETARPIPADFHLQPQEATFFRMLLPPATRNPGGRSTGSIIAASIQGDRDFDLTGKMEINAAPTGAWSGKLLSGEIKGGSAIPVVSFEENQNADAATPFRDKLAELDAKIAALKAERAKLSESLSLKHPNIRKLDAEVEAFEEARASFIATNPQALSDKPPEAPNPLLPPVANPANIAQPLPELVFARRDWSRPAQVAVGDGVTVAIHEEVINRADIMATARIRYTAADGAVTGHDVFLASDAAGSRAKWAYGWVRGTKAFWFCSVLPDNSYSLHRVSFADPQRITDDYQQYYPGEEPQRTLGVPDAFYAQLVGFLEFQKWTVVDKSNGLSEISGQNVASAQPLTPAGVPVKAEMVLPQSKDQRWKVQFVDAATGQPVSPLRATVTSRTADGSRTIHVMKVVSDGVFDRNLNIDEHAWVSVVDESWTNADDAVRLFGNVPADAKATEKHTNSYAPFIVKVKPRVKQTKAGADAAKPDVTDERQRN